MPLKALTSFAGCYLVVNVWRCDFGLVFNPHVGGHVVWSVWLQICKPIVCLIDPVADIFPLSIDIDRRQVFKGNVPRQWNPPKYEEAGGIERPLVNANLRNLSIVKEVTQRYFPPFWSNVVEISV